MKLFLEEGFDKVTIRRIAEKIEYSPGNIYFYFQNKEEILYTLYREGFEELYRRQQVIQTIEDPAKRLKNSGKFIFLSHLNSRGFTNLCSFRAAWQKKSGKRIPHAMPVSALIMF